MGPVSVKEQCNPYKGNPERAWISVRFEALDGTTTELELVVDTGSPFAVVLSQANLSKLKRLDGSDANTNFGLLVGGWLRITMPEFGLKHDILGYGNDVIVSAAKASHSDFEGIVGLPLLRLVLYGGDQDNFMIRSSASNP